MRIKYKSHNSNNDVLANLTLLSNGPELLKRLMPQACDGIVHAQCAGELCNMLLPTMSTEEIARAERI